ncbi:MAG: alanine racemase [Oscillospiraceae bacterium]|nr:alanine racemase [Oscillospiraceae bacterium]
MKRTWAEINLDALKNNYYAIRNAVRPETEICWVVKADGYGHGAVFVARTLEALGARWFAVSNIEEAEQLRSGGIKGAILILGYTPPNLASKLSRLNISQAVFSADYAKELQSCAQQDNVTVKIHLKVDTGMSRIGFLYQEPGRDSVSIDEMEDVCQQPNLEHEGIFTHFAVSDEGKTGKGYTEEQFQAFLDSVSKLEQRGITFRYRHCANSGAVCDYPEMHLDMVRPGIIIYGLNPSGVIRNKLPLQPVMELKTVISMLKTVETNTTVSYGRTFTASRKTKLATVPIGYADGYPRKLHDCADMLVCGQRARVVGRVCMDQLMLDVTDIDGVENGMTVTVFGKDGGEMISVDELAKLNDTINYEMICIVGKRVPRIFLVDGKPIGHLNYICPET